MARSNASLQTAKVPHRSLRASVTRRSCGRTAGAVPLDGDGGKTLQHQQTLPKLPIPPLEDTMKRYLSALAGLQVALLKLAPQLVSPCLETDCRRQAPEEHEATKQIVDRFVKGEGQKLHQKLVDYAAGRDRCAAALLLALANSRPCQRSYIEEFWDEAYLLQNEPTVLALKCVPA